MKNSPEIQWLSDRWDLPPEAIPAVRAWLEAEASGSTACAIEPPACGWGRAAGTDDSPLIVVENEGAVFLQSRRLFDAEREIARRLVELAARSSPQPRLDDLLPTLFSDPEESADQIRAARAALTHDLAIITGGPGSGKTYTLARILALLVATGVDPQSIRLTAPTGKAADRMKSAVALSLEDLPASIQKDGLIGAAERSSTIHSLLGYNPDSGMCRFRRDRPLACEVLIVDECSMVDVHVWRALLDALPESACLVLLGDPNQLESVGQGNVFAELVEGARLSTSPLHATHVHLTRSRRFRERPGIAALANALEDANPDAAIAALRKGAAGLEWLLPGTGRMSFHQLPPAVRTRLENIARAQSAEAAHDALGNVCVLAAQKEFFVGAKAVSLEIEHALAADPATRNQPVIVNRNDPETGLRNGSAGVIHRDDSGRRHAWFRTSGGALTPFPLARLPDFSPAWAITIHRSQGSEYDDVAVILPREESPLATRELVYTAITRARRNVFLFGDEATIRKAVETRSARAGLLGFHLRAPR